MKELTKERAEAAVSAMRDGVFSDDDKRIVLELADHAAKTMPEPMMAAKIIASRRQQEQFRLAEHHGWKGGQDHRAFIPSDVLASFEQETARLVADCGEKTWAEYEESN